MIIISTFRIAPHTCNEFSFDRFWIFCLRLFTILSFVLTLGVDIVALDLLVQEVEKRQLPIWSFNNLAVSGKNTIFIVAIEKNITALNLVVINIWVLWVFKKENATWEWKWRIYCTNFSFFLVEQERFWTGFMTAACHQYLVLAVPADHQNLFKF